MKTGPRFVCLAYHRVTDDPTAQQDPFTVTPATLEAQMKWLARHHYRVVTLGEAWAHPDHRRQIALTFDDGYRDFSTTAWPVLCRYGFTATLFVVTGRMGQTADWPEAEGAALLSRQALRELAAQGVEIGLHGRRHQPFDELETAVLSAELAADRQQAALELGCMPSGIAYPYGRYSPAVVAAVQTAGFAWAATARGGKNDYLTPGFSLRRTLITGKDGGGFYFGLKVRTGYARLVEWRMDLKQILGF